MTTRQLRRTLFIEGFGISGISFAWLAVSGGTSGFYAILLYGLFLFLFAVYFISISNLYHRPKRRETFSSIQKGVSVLFLLRSFINAWFLILLFVHSIHEIYMENQSPVLIELPLLLLLWYFSVTTLEKKSRFLELIFPWIILPFLLMLLTACFYPVAHFSPAVFSPSAFHPQDFRTGFLLLLFATPLEFLFFLFPKTNVSNKKQTSLSQVFLPLLGIFLANVSLWFFTLRIIGRKLTMSTPWSVVKLIQLIHLPGGFLLRIDILLMMYWFFCMLSVISGYLFYGMDIFASAFSCQKKKAYLPALPLCLALLGIFGTPISLPVLFHAFLTYKTYIDFPLLLISPLLLLCNRKKGIKTFAKFAGSFFLILCLGGCSMSTDIEDKSYISSMYVTKKEDDYLFTLTQNVLTSENESQEYIPSNLITMRAASFSSLQKDYQERFSKTLEWNHIETIFLSKSLCSDRQKLYDFLTSWDENWQCSPDVNLVLTPHTAKEIYHIKFLPKGAAGQECYRILKKRSQDISKPAKTPIDYLKLLDNRTNVQKSYCLFIQNNQLLLVATNFLHFH